ncbi:hypothetical protein ACWKWP_02780 [Agromyces soli]
MIVQEREVEEVAVRQRSRWPQALGLALIALVATGTVLLVSSQVPLLRGQLDEYVQYRENVPEFGDTARLHAEEAAFIIRFVAVVVVLISSAGAGFITGIAALTRLPVVRTLLVASGGLLLVAAVMFLYWLLV